MTVDWSYALLGRPEQTVLRRLSVFADGFDLAAAEAVCSLDDIEELEIANHLSSLVDKSLVVAEQRDGKLRYRLLETIRQFSAEHLVDSNEGEANAVATAHCSHFLSLVELAAPHLYAHEQVEWIARLDVDQANIRRAIEDAANDPNEINRLLRFCVALARYWWVRSRSEDAVAICLPAMERPEARGNPALFASAMATVIGGVLDHDVKKALQLGQQALDIARQLDDDRLLSKCSRELGSACFFAGEFEMGFPLAEKCVERSRRLGDEAVLAESLRAYLLYERFLPPAISGALYTEAIAWTERMGDRFMRMTLHNNAGVRALREGDIPAARSHLEQAAQDRDVIGATHFRY